MTLADRLASGIIPGAHLTPNLVPTVPLSPFRNPFLVLMSMIPPLPSASYFADGRRVGDELHFFYGCTVAALQPGLQIRP